MKKILSMFSVLTLVGTTVGSVNLNNNTKINNCDGRQQLKEKIVSSPRNVLLTTAGDMWNARAEWDYATVNLGKLRQEQIFDIVSTKNDSYTEHKVESYGYHIKNSEAGINTNDFRQFFYQDSVGHNWDFNKALVNSYNNFRSSASQGSVTHSASATIKFQWHYDDNNDLLVDIVGTIWITIKGLSTVKSIASIKLGSLFTIKYWE